MCFNKHKWFSWACSVLFFISGVFYIILFGAFFGDEKARLKQIMNESGSDLNTSSGERRDVNIQQNQNKV